MLQTFADDDSNFKSPKPNFQTSMHIVYR